MIAEIVSLSAYESQVSALLTGDERMAMEFIRSKRRVMMMGVRNSNTVAKGRTKLYSRTWGPDRQAESL